METDYREFLRRYAETSKRRRPGFSLGAWAKALGLKSTSSLTKILKGEREAGPRLVEKLCAYFRLSKEEEHSFRELVAISKLKGSEEQKAKLVETLLQKVDDSELQKRVVELDQYDLLSDPKHLIVRELTRLESVGVAELARWMPDLNEGEILKSLNILRRLTFVSQNTDGTYSAKDPSIRTTAEKFSEAVRAYHAQSLNNAITALQEIEPELREFQSLVMLADTQHLPEMKKRIRQFIDSFEAMNETGSVDRAYQLQIQFFPVSKSFDRQSSPAVIPENLRRESK